MHQSAVLRRGASEQKHGLGYFPAIDGLRALAVVSVMIFHLKESVLRGGFVGVDIFFVISGFVVTASIAHLRFETLPDFLAYFYARRVTRIFPALVVCLLSTSILYALFIPQAWLSNVVTRVGLAAFFGAGNIILATDTNTYFSPVANFNPFTHTWSLGVEEQFYVLFPLLMFALSRSELSPTRRRRIIQLIITLSIVSLFACAVLTNDNWKQAFYMLPSRFWELGCGMLLCLTVDRWKAYLAKMPGITTAVAILSTLIIVTAIFLPSSAGFPFPLALLPVLGASGLIVSSVARPLDSTATILSAAPVVFLGKISYSLYLWHWPVLVLMRWTTGLDNGFAYLVAVVVTFSVSLISYFVVEQPMRNLRRTVPSPIVVATGLAAICLLAYCTRSMFGHKNAVTLSRTRDVAAWYPEAPFQCTVIETERSEGNLQINTFTPHDCKAPSSPGRLLVAGDSHAGGYFGVLRKFAQESGREVRLYGLPGCSFLPLVEPTAPKCIGFRNDVAEVLARDAGSHDVLFLASLRMPRYVDQWGEVQKDYHPSTDPKILHSMVEKETQQIVSRISAGGAHIVFEGPPPIFKSPPFRCADWFNAKNPICSAGFTVDRAELETRRAPAMAVIQSLTRNYPNISLWDPFPILCPGSKCNAFMDGKPLFFDGDHLSGFGNQILYPFFKAAMDPYWEP